MQAAQGTNFIPSFSVVSFASAQAGAKQLSPCFNSLLTQRIHFNYTTQKLMWSQKIHFVAVKRPLVLFTGNPYKIDPQVIHSATELTVDMIYGKTFILSE